MNKRGWPALYTPWERLICCCGGDFPASSRSQGSLPHLSQSCGRNGLPASTDLKSSSLLKKCIAVKPLPCQLLSFPGSRCQSSSSRQRGDLWKEHGWGSGDRPQCCHRTLGKTLTSLIWLPMASKAQTHNVKIPPQTPPLHSVSRPKDRDPSVLGGEGLEVSVEGGPQQSLWQQAALRGWDSGMGPKCTRHVES